MTDKAEPSIAELCRPLSARVMPAGARFAAGGGRMSDTAALAAQRRTVAMHARTAIGRDKPDTPTEKDS